ncbi:uncharacterized protein LOC134238271 isoform X2 [Saccostrea cucullata]|uniref:uncharacterized protein LOC134238271 isoform X2 n=1 Tax=Saccostrea cuccullata TaxID=36930 RepID=UPI002ECFCF8E
MIYSPKCCFFIFVVIIPRVILQEGYCKDGDKGVWRCCTDYRNVTGKCEPCIGSFGVECLSLCLENYYGHGCRSACSCASDEHCDRVYGCIHDTICRNNFTGRIELCTNDTDNERNENCSFEKKDREGRFQGNHIVLTAFGSISITSVVWILFFRCKWYREQNWGKKTNSNTRDEIPLSEFPDREKRNNRSEAREVLRQSRPQRQYENEVYNRYSDNYNHLDFRNGKTVPLEIASNSNYSKINLDSSCIYENDLESHSWESSKACIDVSEKLHSGDSEMAKRVKRGIDKRQGISNEHQRNTDTESQKPANSDLQFCSISDFQVKTGDSQKGRSIPVQVEEVDEVYGFNRKDVQSFIGFPCEKPKLDRNNSVC